MGQLIEARTGERISEEFYIDDIITNLFNQTRASKY